MKQLYDARIERRKALYARFFGAGEAQAAEQPRVPPGNAGAGTGEPRRMPPDMNDIIRGIDPNII